MNEFELVTTGGAEAPLFITPEDSLAQQIIGMDQSIPVNELASEAADIGHTMLGGDFVVSNVPEWSKSEDGMNQLPEAGLKTTLPVEFFKMDETGQLYMPASSVDMLEPGEYSLLEAGTSAEIKILSIDGGKYLTSTSQRNDRRLFPSDNSISKRKLPPDFGAFSFAEALSTQLSGNDMPGKSGVKILENVGYKFGFGDSGRTIPSPATLEKIVLESNLPVDIISDTNGTGTIPLRGYLGSFARGRYPVGSGDLVVYAHDVRANDHMVGVATLGAEGLGMLAPIAEASLSETASSTEEDLLKLTTFFDTATARLSGIIAQPDEAMYIELFGVNENSNNATYSLLAMCQEAKINAESFGADFDGGKLFDHLKNRLVELNQELKLGENFGAFLDVLKSTNYVDREKVAVSQSRPTESFYG